MALSVSQISREKSPDATALLQMAQTFAGALGTATAAVIINQAPDTTTSVHLVFLLLSVLVILIFYLFYSLFRAIKNQKF